MIIASYIRIFFDIEICVYQTYLFLVPVRQQTHATTYHNDLCEPPVTYSFNGVSHIIYINIRLG